MAEDTTGPNPISAADTAPSPSEPSQPTSTPLALSSSDPSESQQQPQHHHHHYHHHPHNHPRPHRHHHDHPHDHPPHHHHDHGHGHHHDHDHHHDHHHHDHHHHEESPDPEPRRPVAPPRVDLPAIAASTLEAIDHGSYECNGTVFELRPTVDWMVQNTEFYPPDSELGDWAAGSKDSGAAGAGAATTTATTASAGPEPEGSAQESTSTTEIALVECSTLEGARSLHETLASAAAEGDDKRIGVLNFASAKNPGGGFIRGAQAQEESLARSSTLYASLMISTAQAFYALHRADPQRGFYSHAMIYSPRVQLVRDDEGNWLAPVEVDVLTSPAVNAGVVRQQETAAAEAEARFRRGHRDRDRDDASAASASASASAGADSSSDGPEAIEDAICDTMRERMARVLYLFEKRGVRNLVLGSFGTGVFRNRVEVVAGLWVELLVAGPGARFGRSFDRVVFAVLGGPTFRTFEEVFEPFLPRGAVRERERE